MSKTDVQEWQRLIGVSADGDFGPATLKASKALLPAVAAPTPPPPTTAPAPAPDGMRMSNHGAFALAVHEGIVPAPYIDSVGVWTYGIGHTKAAGAPDPATLPRGMPANLDAALSDVFRLFFTDLATYEAAVRKAVHEPVSQWEFDALVSFHYNTGAIARATLTSTLNAGNHPLAGDQFMNWVSPPEITGRRQAEKDLFKQNRYPQGPATVWQVDGGGHIIWKAARTLTYDQFRALTEGV